MEIIRLKEMEESNLDKLTSKDEEKRMQGIGEKAYEQKYQELEIYVVCIRNWRSMWYVCSIIKPI
jgi:hypothetical protein